MTGFRKKKKKFDLMGGIINKTPSQDMIVAHWNVFMRVQS